MSKKNILQITAHYFPNVGGVETHLIDLVSGLVENNFTVTVLTYRPLTTKTRWKIIEKESDLTVFRIPWFAGFFYQLIQHPILEFLYLFPGLFFVTPFIILSKNIDVINSHGLVAGAVGVFWAKIFRKRVIVSMHSIYDFPKSGMYTNFVKWIFGSANQILCLSQQSKKEIESLGIQSNKISVFTYWVDQNTFKKELNAKNKLQWEEIFTILFVGRLVEEKGILVLLKAVEQFEKNIQLVIAGVGPLESTAHQFSRKYSNVQFIGKIEQKDLSLYYSAADILIVPSTSEEGFGRVILEALSCGLPIIAANRGGILEAVDSTVAKCIDISPQNIAKTINYYFSNQKKLQQMSNNAVEYAKKYYNKQNIRVIIDSYENA